MISSKQIKAARSLLGWKGKDLADKSGVGITTLRRYEAQDGIPNANKFVIKDRKAIYYAMDEVVLYVWRRTKSK